MQYSIKILISRQIQFSDCVGQTAINSTAALQGQLTQLYEEVERLTNENRQLSGSLVALNDQATSDLA
jgi:cell division protein FtsB